MATTNINIPSLNVVQTTAQWAVDVTVYSDKYVLWNSDLFYGATDQMQFKKADGVQTFENLDYMPIGAGGGGSDRVAISYFNTTNTVLVDNTTYRIGQMGGMIAGVTSFCRIPIPSGTLVSVHVSTWTTTTAPTELSVLRLLTNDGAESYEIANDIEWNGRSLNRNFNGLSETITQGNSWVDMTVPTFLTNPTNAQLRVTIIMEL